MKLQALAFDELLINEIKQRDLFSEVHMISSLGVMKDDCLLISDSNLSYENLSDQDFSNREKVFYMLSNQKTEPALEKTVKAICDSLDVVLIPPRLTTSQIVDLIQKEVIPYQKNASNVISFFSSIGNVGTTTTCLSVAKLISQYSKVKIGVLLINAWDSGTTQISFKGNHLHEIKPKLTSRMIDNKEEFLSLFHMESKDSLYILGGNKNTRTERLYTKDEINYLIDKAKTYFDVVLIDCGSHFDNAIIVQSLHESDLRFLVVNQQTKAINKFNQMYDDVLYPIGYTRNDFLLVVNQYEDKSYHPTTKDITKDIQVPFITMIEQNGFGLLSEVESKTMFDYEDEIYKESISKIAKVISSNSGIQLDFQDVKKKKRFFSFIN